jgi:glycosyltransferase involved in cell wall biosynthesis
MKTDICIPAYNEGDIIATAVAQVRDALKALPATVGVIVANNASTDETGQRAAGAGATVLDVRKRGKGAAVVAAAKYSQADIFGFIDADLSAEPSDLLVLLRELEAGADIAIGSRLLSGEGVRRGLMRTLSSKAFNMLRRFLVGVRVADTQCGLKLMNSRGRAVLASCEETGWFFDIEFLARAEKAGLQVREIPIRWEEFRYASRRSKLNLLYDGARAIHAMIRIMLRLKK